MNNYTLNDLPQFSLWPARLLGLENFTQRFKTPKEISREYEDEKWSPLLRRLQSATYPVTVEDVNEWVISELSSTLCSFGEEQFELLSPVEAHRRCLDYVETVLKPHNPASALVELGAGYGRIILDLIKRPIFSQTKAIAGEYTVSGVALIKQLAQAQTADVEVGHCDFTLPHITDLEIPPQAIIFTTYALHYVPCLSESFVTGLLAYQPKVVVHIEPCYEHANEDTLLGLMRRRYIQINDYNTNLVTLLHEQQEQGRVKILEERPIVFGLNPLLPASVIIWTSN
jgi:hypothetical protein